MWPVRLYPDGSLSFFSYRLSPLSLIRSVNAPQGTRLPPSIEASAGEPIKYIGEEETDKRFHHGGLRHAVGVHRVQTLRANRTNPPEGELIGWTYNHAPFLAYWNEKFYLQYLSNLS
jgi:hypothetical protein